MTAIYNTSSVAARIKGTQILSRDQNSHHSKP